MLIMLCWVQHRRLLAFASRVCCWLRVNMVSTKTPRVFSAVSFHPVSLRICLLLIPLQKQTLHFPLLNFEIPFRLFLRSVEASLDVSTNLWHISCFSQFYISAHWLRVHTVLSSRSLRKMTDECWTRYWPLGHTTSDWPLDGLCAADPAHLIIVLFICSLDSMNLDELFSLQI